MFIFYLLFVNIHSREWIPDDIKAIDYLYKMELFKLFVHNISVMLTCISDLNSLFLEWVYTLYCNCGPTFSVQFAELHTHNALNFQTQIACHIFPPTNHNNIESKLYFNSHAMDIYQCVSNWVNGAIVLHSLTHWHTNTQTYTHTHTPTHTYSH